jgi:hypothetical protein
VGRVLAEALVQAVIIEMALVLVKDSADVSFVVDQQPIGALLAHGTNEPFGITVRSWPGEKS